MDYERQELRVLPGEVEALEAQLVSDGWELYRQEGERWPIDETGRAFMQFRRPRRYFIQRTGSPEKLAVEYSIPSGDTFDAIWTHWTQPLLGRFTNFDKLDPKWSWVHGGSASMSVDGKSYVLAAIDSTGNSRSNRANYSHAPTAPAAC